MAGSDVDEAAMLEVLAKIEASKRKVKNANKAAKRKKKSGSAEDETGGCFSSAVPQASDAVAQAIPLVTSGSTVLPPPLTDSPARQDKRQRVGSVRTNLVLHIFTYKF